MSATDFPVVTGVRGLTEGPGWIVVYGTVPMFFALSGFLVSAGAARRPRWRFALGRAMRIAPPLAVVTLFAMLVIGPLCTSRAFWDYIADPGTLVFGITALGDIQYSLPGVFADTPLSEVNASLWTIPSEICGYVALCLLAPEPLTRGWRGPALVILLLLATDLAWRGLGPAHALPFERQFAGSSGKMICTFMGGAMIHALRHHVPLSAGLAAASAGFLVLAALFGSPALAAQTGQLQL